MGPRARVGVPPGSPVGCVFFSDCVCGCACGYVFVIVLVAERL